MQIEVTVLKDGEALQQAFSQIVESADELYMAYAWASTGATDGHWSVLLRGRAKIRKAVLGYAFGQTDVQALRDLHETQRLRVLILDKGTFHPKVMVGLSADRAWAIVGSSNLTRGGFSANVELNILLQGDVKSPAIGELLDFIGAAWEVGVAPDESWLASYATYCELLPPKSRLPLEPRLPKMPSNDEQLGSDPLALRELSAAQATLSDELQCRIPEALINPIRSLGSISGSATWVASAGVAGRQLLVLGTRTLFFIYLMPNTQVPSEQLVFRLSFHSPAFHVTEETTIVFGPSPSIRNPDANEIPSTDKLPSFIPLFSNLAEKRWGMLVVQTLDELRQLAHIIQQHPVASTYRMTPELRARGSSVLLDFGTLRSKQSQFKWKMDLVDCKGLHATLHDLVPFHPKGFPGATSVRYFVDAEGEFLIAQPDIGPTLVSSITSQTKPTVAREYLFFEILVSDGYIVPR